MGQHELDTEEKFEAIIALDQDACLKIKSREWYVQAPNLQIFNEDSHRSLRSMAGSTVDSALRAIWLSLTNLKRGECVGLLSSDPIRWQYVYWNGFMWKDIPDNHPVKLALAESEEGDE